MYLDSLRFETINSRHATIRAAHAKTCSWITKTPEYQSWLNEQDLSKHHGFFWIKGKPGAGKSTMMKYLLAQTTKTCEDAKVVAFFFNARGENLEKTTRGMYQSILFQILEKLPYLQDVLALCPPKMISEGCFKWETDNLKTALGHAITRIQQTSLFVFVDALDECDEDEVRDMIELFEHLGDVASTHGLPFRTCFSSRHYPSLSIDGSVGLALEEREGHQHDIEEYLRTEVKAGHSKHVNEIREEVLHRASGIFLWVVLVVRILNTEYRRGNKHSMKKKLAELPDGLERLFEDILRRDNQNIEQLQLVLQWVLFTSRPLKVEELYFAVLAGVEPDLIPRWDLDELNDSLEDARRFVLNNSKGLVEETRSNPRSIQFIHETVRDFFLKENGLKDSIFGSSDNFEARAHDKLRQCCQNYYNHVDIQEITGVLQDLPKATSTDAGNLREKADRMFPFLKYTVQNVLYHSDKAHGLHFPQQRFIQEFDLQRWTFLNNLFEKHEIRRYSRQVQLLYILASKNLPQLIRLEFKRTGGVESKGERYGFPLAAACHMKNENAVRALLQCYLGDRSDILQRDMESAVSSLLEGPLNVREKDTILPQWAARFANENVFAIVCFNGKAHTSSCNSNNSSLPFHSSESPHRRMSQLLSKFIQEASGPDSENPIAIKSLVTLDQNVTNFLELFPDLDMGMGTINAKFHDAMALGYVAVARLFLSWDVNIDTQNEHGKTALHMACFDLQFRQNRLSIMKLLLASGASVNMKDRYDRTALHRACTLAPPEEAIVDLLLMHGADVDILDDGGETALYKACRWSNNRVAEILLIHGADVDANGCSSGGTPLHVATRESDKPDLIELLLEHGAGIDSKDNDGQTPLHNASRWGRCSAVESLLKHGASVDIKDDKGETALHKASIEALDIWRNEDYFAVLKLLLAHGADIYATDGLDRTALSLSKDLRLKSAALAELLEPHIAKVESERFWSCFSIPRDPDIGIQQRPSTLDKNDTLVSDTTNDDQYRDGYQHQADLKTAEAGFLTFSDPHSKTESDEFPDSYDLPTRDAM